MDCEITMSHLCDQEIKEECRREDDLPCVAKWLLESISFSMWFEIPTNYGRHLKNPRGYAGQNIITIIKTKWGNLSEYINE